MNENKIINDWDEKLYKSIAKASGSKQAVEDVSYARFCFFHNPEEAVHLRIDKKGFILANMHKNSCRIIGMATGKKWKRGGVASRLLDLVEKLAKEKYKEKIYIRTYEGYGFFKDRGYFVSGRSGKDYILEKRMSDIKHNYMSPRWSGELTDCTMPMTFDTYSNCSFGCVYCFSQYQRGIGNGKENYFAKDVKSVNPEKIKKIFTEPESSQFWDYVKNRKVFQWGGFRISLMGLKRNMA